MHKRGSPIYILAEEGDIEPRIRTEPVRFATVLGSRPRAGTLIEASTGSEWIARCLEALGHEVIVAEHELRAHVCDAIAQGEDRPMRMSMQT
jgi:hypothetical protein